MVVLESAPDKALEATVDKWLEWDLGETRQEVTRENKSSVVAIHWQSAWFGSHYKWYIFNEWLGLGWSGHNHPRCCHLNHSQHLAGGKIAGRWRLDRASKDHGTKARVWHCWNQGEDGGRLWQDERPCDYPGLQMRLAHCCAIFLCCLGCEI